MFSKAFSPYLSLAARLYRYSLEERIVKSSNLLQMSSHQLIPHHVCAAVLVSGSQCLHGSIRDVTVNGLSSGYSIDPSGPALSVPMPSSYATVGGRAGHKCQGRVMQGRGPRCSFGCCLTGMLWSYIPGRMHNLRQC